MIDNLYIQWAPFLYNPYDLKYKISTTQQYASAARLDLLDGQSCPDLTWSHIPVPSH